VRDAAFVALLRGRGVVVEIGEQAMVKADLEIE
jgi:hypothetical protein